MGNVQNSTGGKVHARESMPHILALGFLLNLAANFFAVFSYAVLIKVMGAEILSDYYIILNLLCICLAVAFICGGQHDIRNLIVAVVLTAVASLSFGLFAEFPNPAVSFAMAVVAGLFMMFSAAFYWNAVRWLFNISELKAQMGRLTTNVAAGFALAGVIVYPVMSLLSINQLLICYGVFLFLVAGYIWRINGYFLFNLAPLKNPVENVIHKVQEVLKLDLVYHLLICTLLFCLIRYVGDYQLAYVVGPKYHSEKELAAFFGIFSASLTVAVLLWRLLVLDVISKSLAVTYFYLSCAVVYVVLTMVCVAKPMFYTIAFFQWMCVFMIKAMEQPATCIFLKSVPGWIRGQANLIVIVMGQSMAVLIAGFVIKGLQHVDLHPQLFFLAMNLFAVLLFLQSLRLAQPYIRMLLATLVPDLLKSAHSPKHLLHSLSSERNVKNISLYEEDIGILLQTEKDPNILARAAELLASIRGPDVVPKILPLLKEDNLWLRSTVLVLVFRLSRNEREREAAMQGLLRMAASKDQRERVLVDTLKAELKR
ncbi:MAG TPA: MFS transporter, partial [Elusimicrobiales bacterium]|nr:MFS transporter [Elusimicrobiales bacterium]